MLRSGALYLIPILLALSAGPFAITAGTLNHVDQDDLYLVLTVPGQIYDRYAQYGASEAYPTRAPFAHMIQADPTAHSALVQAGFWLFPASMLAALCTPDQNQKVLSS